MRDFLAIPFGWILSGLYTLTDSYLLSIIVLTLVVRLALLPASISQQKNSAKQVRLNTKVNKIKQKYAGNQQKIQEETQALYQREGFGAANMGCMPLIVQMLVMLGLYEVMYTPIKNVLRFSAEKITAIQNAMSIVETKENARRIQLDILAKLASPDALEGVKGVNTNDIEELFHLKENFMLGSLDLTATPDKSNISLLWLIPVFAFLTSMMSSIFMYIKQRKQNPEMAKNPSMGCMTFMSPVMSLVFTFMFPAGVGFYWIVSNVFSFVQQVILTYVYSPKKVIAQQMVDETVTRRSKENNTKRRVDIEKK
ncbi:MAG: YidC/Oxa1 family membrane protein insertase [Clostridia bacterium]|nr:YidC/Oxa1 family membrane protein insertase [Clostridia bacterium]